MSTVDPRAARGDEGRADAAALEMPSIAAVVIGHLSDVRDRLRLGSVSRAWRRLAASPGAWQGASPACEPEAPGSLNIDERIPRDQVARVLSYAGKVRRLLLRGHPVSLLLEQDPNIIFSDLVSLDVSFCEEEEEGNPCDTACTIDFLTRLGMGERDKSSRLEKLWGPWWLVTREDLKELDDFVRYERQACRVELLTHELESRARDGFRRVPPCAEDLGGPRFDGWPCEAEGCDEGVYFFSSDKSVFFQDASEEGFHCVHCDTLFCRKCVLDDENGVQRVCTECWDFGQNGYMCVRPGCPSVTGVGVEKTVSHRCSRCQDGPYCETHGAAFRRCAECPARMCDDCAFNIEGYSHHYCVHCDVCNKFWCSDCRMSGQRIIECCDPFDTCEACACESCAEELFTSCKCGRRKNICKKCAAELVQASKGYLDKSGVFCNRCAPPRRYRCISPDHISMGSDDPTRSDDEDVAYAQ